MSGGGGQGLAELSEALPEANPMALSGRCVSCCSTCSERSFSSAHCVQPPPSSGTAEGLCLRGAPGLLGETGLSLVNMTLQRRVYRGTEPLWGRRSLFKPTGEG